MSFDRRLTLRNAGVLHERLRAGERVQAQQLVATLGHARWEKLEAEINAIKEARFATVAVPEYIVRAMRPYTERLAYADKLDRLADYAKASQMPSIAAKRQMRMRGLSAVSGKSSREVYRIRAEVAYEKAIEKLHEIIDEFPEILTYLDRYPVFDGENFNVTPDGAGVPRLRNSRSRYNMAPRMPVQSIRSLKINALENLILDLSSISP